MSKQRIEEILSANPSAVQVLIHDGRYVAFSDDPHRDFVRIGVAKGFKGSALYHGTNLADVGADDCAELCSKLIGLSDPALHASFRMAPWQIKFAQSAIRSINATHFVLFGDEGGVFFNCFDALRFVPEARMTRGYETKLLTHHLREAPSRPFHITLNAASMMKLPKAHMSVGIGKNKVAIFTDDKTDDMYLMRDQEVSAPMVHFFSDRLQQEIALSLHSKSLFRATGTNQPDHPELEFDDLDHEHLLDP